MVLGYSREFQGVFIGDFLVETPNITNDMSVSIVFMRSSQWCVMFCHLRYFYVVKYQ
jgi:hypothetical protein